MSNKYTSPNQYRTDDNGDYGICTVQLREGDWMATTREFTAFGKTEPEALGKLGRFMKEAADSITKLAIKLAHEVGEPKHPTNPPHCRTCGEYGCTKHTQELKSKCCNASLETIGLIDQVRCTACLRLDPSVRVV